MKRFIPKISDLSLLDAKLSEFYIDADVIEWRPKVFSEYSTKFPKYTIDPKTNRFAYSPTKSMEKLNYFIPHDLIPDILNDSSIRYTKLIIPCTKYQLDKGAQSVIPPYFYVEDTNSQPFYVNVESITNVIKYLEKENITAKVTPMINISLQALTNDVSRKHIVSMYTSEEFVSKIDCFYLTVNGLDTLKATVDELKGLLILVKALSKYGVRVVSINGFGHSVLLLGADAFISGLASGDKFNVDFWLDSIKNKRGRNTELVYVPEIFGYIYRDELIDNSYECSCEYCKGSIPQSSSDNKKHYYYCMIKDIESIFDNGFDSNLSNLRNLYSSAKDLASNLVKERKTKRRGDVLISPLVKWLEVLEYAESINGLEEAEDKLAKLLEALDNYDKDSN